MSLDNLITNRTAADLAEAVRIIGKVQRGDELTDAEAAAYAAGLKGCYNCTDLNRVEAAVRELAATLRDAGYPADVQPIYKSRHVESVEGYERLQYIESSGSQYIDTGLKPDGTGTEITITFELTSGTTAAAQAIYGARSTANSADSAANVLFALDSGAARFDYYGSSYTGATLTVGTRYTAQSLISDSSSQRLTVAGESGFLTKASTTSAHNLTLFAVNTGGTPTLFGKFKLFACQIYSNGAIIRDFIPMRRKADGVCGLLDREHDAFYANAGSGAFGYSEREPDVVVTDGEWLETDTVHVSQWETYIGNIDELKRAFYVKGDTPALPDAAAALDIDGANAIEKILLDISALHDCMQRSYRRCGATAAGNNAVHLPLKGSGT